MAGLPLAPHPADAVRTLRAPARERQFLTLGQWAEGHFLTLATVVVPAAYRLGAVGGTDEIQRDIVAERVPGLPKEPRA